MTSLMPKQTRWAGLPIVLIEELDFRWLGLSRSKDTSLKVSMRLITFAICDSEPSLSQPSLRHHSFAPWRERKADRFGSGQEVHRLLRTRLRKICQASQSSTQNLSETSLRSSKNRLSTWVPSTSHLCSANSNHIDVLCLQIKTSSPVEMIYQRSRVHEWPLFQAVADQTSDQPLKPCTSSLSMSNTCTQTATILKAKLSVNAAKLQSKSHQTTTEPIIQNLNWAENSQRES